MSLERYTGSKFTLHTAVGADECRERLSAEFSDARGRWQHAAADSRLIGLADGHDFLVLFSHYLTHPHPRIDAGDSIFLSMAVRTAPILICRLRFRHGTGGTTIAGSYGYSGGERHLLRLAISLPPMITIGILLIVAGLVMAFEDASGLLVLLLGTVAVCGCVAYFRQSDEKFLRERDYIARYLTRVLEAQEVPPARAKSGGSGRREMPMD
jgi:hypothetical protein